MQNHQNVGRSCLLKDYTMSGYRKDLNTPLATLPSLSPNQIRPDNEASEHS